MFGMVSGPVTDVISARLAAQYSDTDGYVTNTVLGGDEPRTESFFARGSVLIDSGGPASLLLKLEGGKTDIDGNAIERNSVPLEDLVRDAGGFPGFVHTDFDNTDTLNAAATGTDPYRPIAALIIERQLQKIISRATYRQEDLPDDEERW